MPRPVITLLTDFGTSDTYVGEMKGVILGIAPDASIVDLTHDVPPQAVSQGSFLLGRSYTAFPKETVHLAVVDPGVGTARRGLLLVSPQYRFVGPDNGLFSHVLREGHGGPVTDAQGGLVRLPPGWRGYALTDRRYWRGDPSATFHGRDVFAPAAAHVAAGVAPERMGEPVDRVVYAPPPAAVRERGTVLGVVVHVDRFGNLVTCIPSGLIPRGTVEVAVGGTVIRGLSRTYQDGPRVLALVGSHGMLEIAVRDGDAARDLGVGVGAEVAVRQRTPGSTAAGLRPAAPR